jgi:hypothetical protein
MALNGSWKAKFLQVDFDAWETFNYDTYIKWGDTTSAHFSNSTLWFDLGFVVYSIIIVASILLILSLVWKIMLMKGEKRLLNGDTTVKGGAIA